MNSIKINPDYLLNIDTWNSDNIDEHGIYKELITANKVYRIYSYGKLYMCNNNEITEIKKIELRIVNDDIIVIAS
jgi:hypothetical protein